MPLRGQAKDPAPFVESPLEIRVPSFDERADRYEPAICSGAALGVWRATGPERRGGGGIVTPPDTMNAITSELSASSGSTALVGKMRSDPAKLYDCGRYTATCSCIPIESSVSCVTKPIARAWPPKNGVTTTGLSKRRFSPTKALSRSRVLEY